MFHSRPAPAVSTNPIRHGNAGLGGTSSRNGTHLCGGLAKCYPYPGGFGPNDRTLDITPTTEPDFLQDARDPLPLNDGKPWRAVLIDPPYSPEDAVNYELGAGVYPSPYALVTNALKVVDVGGKVGIIHYAVPSILGGSVSPVRIRWSIWGGNR